MTNKGEDTAHKPEFRQDIEGLRGLAILAVVLFHIGFRLTPGGFLGVDVFFVLSGFLITGILLREADEGRLNLMDFYARRMRRLLPAAILVILTVLAVAFVIFRFHVLKETAKSAGASAGYVANLYFYILAGNYFAGSMESNPFAHMWSLSVEEQFYLFWPGLIWLAARGRQMARNFYFLFSTVFVISLAGGWWASAGPDFFRPELRAWEFAAGALVALGVRRGAVLGAPKLVALAASVGSLVGLILMIASFVFFYGPARQIDMIWLVAGTCLVLAGGSINRERGASRLLATWPLRMLGRYSYSWYLWHWPFLVLGAIFLPEDTGYAKTVLVLLAFGVAVITYHFYENPLRRAKSLVLNPKKTIIIGLGATVAVVVFSLGVVRLVENSIAANPDDIDRYFAEEPWQTNYNAVCGNNIGNSINNNNIEAPKICIQGDPLGSKVIFLWGDSHAIQWLAALHEMAARRHWKLVVGVYFGCAATGLSNKTEDESQKCRAWAAKIEKVINAMRPDMVILSHSHEYIADKKRGYEARNTPEEWQKEISRVLTTLDRASIPVVIIQDIPRFRRPPMECLSGLRKWVRGATCDIEKDKAFNYEALQGEKAVALGKAQVSFLDLTKYFCGPITCPAMAHGQLLYGGTNHLSSRYARLLGPYVLEHIDQTKYLAPDKGQEKSQGKK